MKKTIALHQQSLADICIQNYGSLDALMVLAVANGMAVSDGLLPGQVLLLPVAEGDVDIVRYYNVNGIIPATSASAFATAADIHYAVAEYVVEGYWI